MILSQDADRSLPIASTTKLMTVLLTLEEAAKDDRTVEFTAEMAAEGSSMYLKAGEKLRLSDLAAGMMMQSGNDAANAAAIAVAGSTEAFAQRMNDRAEALGMTHTHFVTPSGLDDEAHYSSAHDMALLMANALQNEAFAALTAQTSMTVDFAEPSDKHVTYPNHNRLLTMYPACIGGKTGYTQRAGRCLVTAAKRDGLTLVAVTLNDRDDWNDHMALYDEGFERFVSVRLSPDDRSVTVAGGARDAVRLTADAPDAAVVARARADDLVCVYRLPAFVHAPVTCGEELGRAEYRLDGRLIARVALRAAEDVACDKTKRSMIQYIKDLLNWHS